MVVARPMIPPRPLVLPLWPRLQDLSARWIWSILHGNEHSPRNRFKKLGPAILWTRARGLAELLAARCRPHETV